MQWAHAILHCFGLQFQRLKRNQKIDRLFLVMSLIVQTMEYDLVNWMLMWVSREKSLLRTESVTMCGSIYILETLVFHWVKWPRPGIFHSLDPFCGQAGSIVKSILWSRESSGCLLIMSALIFQKKKSPFCRWVSAFVYIHASTVRIFIFFQIIAAFDQLDVYNAGFMRQQNVGWFDCLSKCCWSRTQSWRLFL